MATASKMKLKSDTFIKRYYQGSSTYGSDDTRQEKAKKSEMEASKKKGLHPKDTKSPWGDHEQSWWYVVFYPRKSPRHIHRISR